MILAGKASRKIRNYHRYKVLGHPKIIYFRCVEIQTIYPDPERQGTAIGRLVVKEIRHNVTIDYEEFEVLFLTIRVVDVNTVIGQDYDECKYFK